MCNRFLLRVDPPLLRRLAELSSMRWLGEPLSRPSIFRMSRPIASMSVNFPAPVATRSMTPLTLPSSV